MTKRAELESIYARAAMDLRTARLSRDRLALKIARIHLNGGTFGGETLKMFDRAERAVKAAEDRLEHAAEDCDAAEVRHG